MTKEETIEDLEEIEILLIQFLHNRGNFVTREVIEKIHISCNNLQDALSIIVKSDD